MQVYGTIFSARVRFQRGACALWFNPVTQEECMTMKLELNDKEVSVLTKTLEIYISDLRLEIADTEKEAMRDTLKEEEVVLKEILQRLKAG